MTKNNRKKLINTSFDKSGQSGRVTNGNSNMAPNGVSQPCLAQHSLGYSMQHSASQQVPQLAQQPYCDASVRNIPQAPINGQNGRNLQSTVNNTVNNTRNTDEHINLQMAPGYMNLPSAQNCISNNTNNVQANCFSNGQPQTFAQQQDNYNGLAEMITQMNNNFMDRLCGIERNMAKLGHIENEISFVRSEISNIKKDNLDINRRLMDIEIISQNTSDNFDHLCQQNEQSSKRINDLQKENESLNISLSELRMNHTDLKEEFLELKTRSMQENLLFFGIPEQPRSENGNIRENTEATLRSFMATELPLDSPECLDTITFDRVHRLGYPKRNTQTNPRPIIAKFERFTDREKIRKAGFELNKNQYSKYKVREQFPDEIEDRRRNLYPVMFRLKRNPNNRVNLVRDKLFVNGELYIPERDPDYRPLPPRKFTYGERNSVRAELPHQSTSVTYIGHGARPKSSVNRPNNRAFTQQAGNQRPLQTSGTRLSQSVNIVERTPVETSNFFSPLQNKETDNVNVPRKATSPLLDPVSPKKQRQTGVFTSQTVSQTENKMDTQEPQVVQNSSSISSTIQTLTTVRETVENTDINLTDQHENSDVIHDD